MVEGSQIAGNRRVVVGVNDGDGLAGAVARCPVAKRREAVEAIGMGNLGRRITALSGNRGPQSQRVSDRSRTAKSRKHVPRFQVLEGACPRIHAVKTTICHAQSEHKNLQKPTLSPFAPRKHTSFAGEKIGDRHLTLP